MLNTNARIAHPDGQDNVGRKYKSRKERPCDACRKRKICCTKDAPGTDCSLCKTRGESCKYILPPNLRRAKPQSALGVDSPTNSSASASSVAPPIIPSISDSSASEIPRNAATSEWICQFVGLSGDQDPFVLRNCSFNQLNWYKTCDWACIRVKSDSDVPLHFIAVPDSHMETRPEYSPAIDIAAIVGSHAEHLLRTYFDFVHVSYPILDPSRFSSEHKTSDLLLATMYNLTSPFCQQTGQAFKDLSDFIHQALPIERSYPRLDTIEACLLFLQIHNTNHPASATSGLWANVGAMAGLAHDLGLNVDPSAWSLSQSDANRRIRIWWAVYIQDKWSALGLGRPSYLNDDNCNVPMITIHQFSHTGLNDIPLGPIPALIFVAAAQLTTILSDLLSTFYTVKAVERMKHLPLQMLYRLMDEFQARIHTFHDQHLCHVYTMGTSLDSSGSIILAFHTVETVLYRAILRILPITDPIYVTVRGNAKKALLNIVSFLENLQTCHLRSFWWIPMSRINFSLAGSFMYFLLLTSTAKHDIQFWSQTISHYRSLLHLQSQPHPQCPSACFNITKLASARMDLIAAAIGLDRTLVVPPLDSVVYSEHQDEDGEQDDEIFNMGRMIMPNLD